MQTKQQIKQLLASAAVVPNKRLGQHFLIDLNLMRTLLKAADIRHNDIVLEVGCGTGSLTEELAQAAGKVIAVEYDKTLALITSSRLKDAGNIEIINADVLASKNTFCRALEDALQRAKGMFPGRVLLVANLPYSIAASVTANLIVGPIIADEMYITVQKEVAERMVAGAGGKRYGVLSILMGATGQTKIIRKLPAKVFWPEPQVESTMISFVRQEAKIQQIHDLAIFKETVNLFMAHRRKMLKASVKFAQGRLANVHNWQDIFDRAFVEPHHRPEDLSPDNYVAIANLCYEQVQ